MDLLAVTITVGYCVRQDVGVAILRGEPSDTISTFIVVSAAHVCLCMLPQVVIVRGLVPSSAPFSSWVNRKASPHPLEQYHI